MQNIIQLKQGVIALSTSDLISLASIWLCCQTMEDSADLGLDDSDSSGDESISSDAESEDGSDYVQGLTLTKEEVDANYLLLGTSVKPDPPVVVLANMIEKYPGAVTERSERLLAAVLEETPLGFELSDFQVGSLCSETNSGSEIHLG